MNKIIVFVENYEGFMKIYIDNIVKSLIKKKFNIFLYSYEIKKKQGTNCFIQKDLKYLIQNKDPRIYEQLFKYAKKKKIKKIYIPRFSSPEFLYASIISIKNNFEIYLSTFAFELFSKSIGRLTIIKKLLLEKCIKNVAVHSILNKHLKAPNKFNLDKIIIKKLIFMSEPKYYPDYNFKKKIKKNSKIFKLLFFGNFFFGKGVDILVKSTNKLSNHIKVIIASNQAKKNFQYKIIKNKKITFLNKYFTNKEMFKLFKSSDAVVLPYRKTYTYLTSGVLVQSIQSHIPVLVPKIYPFDEVVKKYKLGISFIAESSKDLTLNIKKLVVLIKKNNFKQEKFINYIKDINSWDDFAENIK
jgi:glycosyltransferase involved in cell wall biosynthesis